MDRRRYMVDAVVVEGRGVSEVARSFGASKGWVSTLVSRYRTGGYDAIAPQSKRPYSSPGKVSDDVENAIVAVRKRLAEDGFDAGPQTIAWHLSRTLEPTPSVSTIWRVLKRRGFVVPEPQKRPRSSFIRFEAALPNECWQADITHWVLAHGADVEIIDFIDDYSRLIVAATARMITKGHDVLATFEKAAQTWGYPASVLTDNGAVFNARSRKGRTIFEAELEELGIVYKHSRPYHPQTCGKIERWHQTLKRYLDRQPPAASIAELQAQVDRFVAYYNEERPHRARDRLTPRSAFDARDKAGPGTPVQNPHFRVRTDRIDTGGSVTLRHDSKLFHIGIGRRYSGLRVRLYIVDLDIRIVTFDGELLRHLTLDPTRVYQAVGNRQKL
jgi:transposase InsO family protein